MQRLSLVLSLFLLLLRPAYADLVCDGVDDQIVTANVTGVPTTYPLTVTLIVRLTTGIATDAVPVQLGRESTASPNGILTYFDGTQMKMWLPGTSGFAGTAGVLPGNQWAYAAWSIASATSQRFYLWNYETRTTLVDATTAANIGAFTPPVGSVKMCREETNAGTFVLPFPGTIRQVAVYDKAWVSSADPFRAMAYLGPLAFATPRLLYNFQGKTGDTTVREQQGTGNTGTMTNFSATPWVPMNYPRAFWVQ